MARQELKSQDGEVLCMESFAEEYCAPCCAVTEAGIEALRDESLSSDGLIEFVSDIFAIATEGEEPQACYVIHFPDRWPELYTEEALQKSLESYVRGRV